MYQAVPLVNEIQCVYDPSPVPEFKVEDFEAPVKEKAPDPSVFEVFDIRQLYGHARRVCRPARQVLTGRSLTARQKKLTFDGFEIRTPGEFVKNTIHRSVI